jgi:hypothetical protein
MSRSELKQMKQELFSNINSDDVRNVAKKDLMNVKILKSKPKKTTPFDEMKKQLMGDKHKKESNIDEIDFLYKCKIANEELIKFQKEQMKEQEKQMKEQEKQKIKNPKDVLFFAESPKTNIPWEQELQVNEIVKKLKNKPHHHAHSGTDNSFERTDNERYEDENSKIGENNSMSLINVSMETEYEHDSWSKYDEMIHQKLKPKKSKIITFMDALMIDEEKSNNIDDDDVDDKEQILDMLR